MHAVYPGEATKLGMQKLIFDKDKPLDQAKRWVPFYMVLVGFVLALVTIKKGLKHIGLDMEGTFREKDDMGMMYFQRTLEDWAKFDISNRTKFDAAISTGLAIMANQKHMYTPTKEKSKISINFARYNNKSSVSQLLNR